MANSTKGSKWPAFITADLGDSDADATEMDRRWAVYAQEMAALIAAGGVHKDADGWWVDDATGDLIGPDPELERPWKPEMFAQARPFAETHPALAESIRRVRGRQKAPRKHSTTIRLSPDVVAYFRQTGPGWQTRIDAALQEWVAAQTTN